MATTRLPPIKPAAKPAVMTPSSIPAAFASPHTSGSPSAAWPAYADPVQRPLPGVTTSALVGGPQPTLPSAKITPLADVEGPARGRGGARGGGGGSRGGGGPRGEMAEDALGGVGSVVELLANIHSTGGGASTLSPPRDGPLTSGSTPSSLSTSPRPGAVGDSRYAVQRQRRTSVARKPDDDEVAAARGGGGDDDDDDDDDDASGRSGAGRRGSTAAAAPAAAATVHTLMRTGSGGSNSAASGTTSSGRPSSAARAGAGGGGGLARNGSRSGMGASGGVGGVASGGSGSITVVARPAKMRQSSRDDADADGDDDDGADGGEGSGDDEEGGSGGGARRGRRAPGGASAAASGGDAPRRNPDWRPARKGELPSEITGGKSMTAYRKEVAEEFAAKAAELERVNVMYVRHHGLMVKLRDGHTSAVTVVAFADDGNLLATASSDGLILIWNLESCEIQRRLDNHTGAVTDLHWSPAQEANVIVSCGQDGTVKIWNVDTGTCTLTLRDHGANTVFGCQWASDGSMLATAGSSKHVLVYNMQRIAADMERAKHHSRDMIMVDVKPRGTGAVHGHSASIRRILWSRDNNQIVTASDDAAVKAWDVTVGGRFLRSFRGHSAPVLDLSLDPEGRRLATASADGSARLWRYATGDCLRIFGGEGAPIPGHVGRVLTVRFTPEGGGRRLVTGGEDKAVCVWETYSGLLMQKMELIHKAGINAVDVRPDGLVLATASADATIGLWRALEPTTFEVCGWATYSCGKTCWSLTRALVTGEANFGDGEEEGEGEADYSAPASGAASGGTSGSGAGTGLPRTGSGTRSRVHPASGESVGGGGGLGGSRSSSFSTGGGTGGGGGGATGGAGTGTGGGHDEEEDGISGAPGGGAVGVGSMLSRIVQVRESSATAAGAASASASGGGGSGVSPRDDPGFDEGGGGGDAGESAPPPVARRARKVGGHVATGAAKN